MTLSVYYYVWYHRINRDLATVLGGSVRPNGRWWNQIIPVWNLVGLGSTAVRLNSAHTKLGSPTRVGVGTSWLWVPIWFASHTRYLQRRINVLDDVMASRAAAGL